MAVQNGTNLRIYVNTGSGTAHAIAYATSCTIDFTGEERDTLTKDSTGSWRELEIGQLSGTISGEALFAEDPASDVSSTRTDYFDLFTVFKNKTKIYWMVSQSTSASRNATEDSAKTKTTGFGYITSLSKSGEVEQNTTFSFTLAMTGEPTTATIT